MPKSIYQNPAKVYTETGAHYPAAVENGAAEQAARRKASASRGNAEHIDGDQTTTDPRAHERLLPASAHAQRCAIGGEAAASAVGAGLVCSSTSDTPPTIAALDPRKMRLNRLRRSVLTTARLHQDALQASKFRFKAAMLTLTYAPDEKWNERQITGLLKNCREYLRRRGHVFRYVWVMELTKAGVPHYHIMMWLPKGVTLPKPDKRGWWPYGHTRIEWARKAVSYIAKYASKAVDGGDFPKGARIHGNGGLTQPDRWERSWWMLPRYIRDYSPDPRENGTAKRAPGGGWLTPFGEWLPSRFKITSFNPLAVTELAGWPYSLEV